MIGFELKEVRAIGNANILDNGNCIQKCMMTVDVVGVVILDQQLNNIVDFEIPNSVMAASSTPLLAGWEYIKTVLAPEWVANNFVNS
jgi:hypothetical protein